MEKKKWIAWMIGAMCAMALTAGLILLLPYKTVITVFAIVIICLSICTGILAPNPVSLYGLLIGICMLVFPPQIIGFVLLGMGVIGACANWFSWKMNMA